MKATDSSSLPALKALPLSVVELDRITRWDVYRRLQELSIACECKSGEPLRVHIDGPTTAIQLWSVIRSATVSRKGQGDYLERCWSLAR